MGRGPDGGPVRRRRGLRARLARWWFAPAPPERLAVLRILQAAWSLWYLGRRHHMLRRVAGGDPRLFAPVGVARPLSRPLPVTVVTGIQAATYAAGVAVLLGWRHRVTGPAWSAGVLGLLSYRNSWSMIYHNDNLMVLHALVTGVAPASDALALDAARVRGRRSRRGLSDGRYGWPLQLMTATTAATYWLAGIAKLAGPLGWRWGSGETLRRQVGVDAVRKDLLGADSSPWVGPLYRQVGLWRALATGSLLLELLAPVSVLSRHLGRRWSLVALGLHWGILVVMRITFRYQLSGLAFGSTVDLERLVARMRSR